MAITIDDFSKIWASTSPLTPYEFSENNYKQGWNFVGGTPPSRQMWDFLQKNNDKKMQYLANNYLPLSGGTMTGAIRGNWNISTAVIKNSDVNNGNGIIIDGGYTDDGGGQLVLAGKGSPNNPGVVVLRPRNSNGFKELIAYPNGTLTWGGISLTDGTFIKVQCVNITNYVAQSHVCDVTAPTVSGYQFVVWVSYSTSGFSCPMYFENPTNQSTTMWTSSTLVSSVLTGAGKSISAYALYVRKW